MTGPIRLPDFIIGGAARSGTTWLYHLLDRHPGIYMAKPVRPEPKFFLMDDLFAKGIDYYSQRWFADAPAGAKLGEKSTNYLEGGQKVADRICTVSPDSKLIFSLRNPVTRAFSNYLWSKMNGLENETFERALELEPERLATTPPEWRHSPPGAYFARGLYADLLTPFFERFPREQIMVLRFEDVTNAAGAATVAARLHRFLGVEERIADSDQLPPINPSKNDGEIISGRTANDLAQRYAEPNQRLAAMLGDDAFLWKE